MVGVLNQIGSPSVTPGTPNCPETVYTDGKIRHGKGARDEDMEPEEQIDLTPPLMRGGG